MIFSLPRRQPDASDVTQGKCSTQSSGFCPAVLLGETFRSVTVLFKARTTDTTAERIAIPKEGGDRRVRWVYPPSPHVLIQDYLLLGETGHVFYTPAVLVRCCDCSLYRRLTSPGTSGRFEQLASGGPFLYRYARDGSSQHLGDDGGPEERGGRLEHVEDFQEPPAHAGVLQGEREHPVHVAVGEARREARLPALDIAHPEVLTRGQKPRPGRCLRELFLEAF